MPVSDSCIPKKICRLVLNIKKLPTYRRLGTVAVHGLMSGFTDFSVGLVRDEPVMIPVDILVAAGSRRIKRRDYDWQRLIQATGQWNFLDPENYAKVIK